MAPLVAHHGNAGVAVKIIQAVFAAVINQQVFFFIKQLEDVPLAGFKMRRELNGQGRAGLFAETAKNAAGKIDAKPGGMASAVRALGRLHGDAVNRTDSRAQITGHATFIPVRITRQDDGCARALRKPAFEFRIRLGDGLSEQMP